MSRLNSNVINFENINSTAIPPFEFRPGGLLELFDGRLTRGVSRFDVVENRSAQAKPVEFGRRSLDPFFSDKDGTPFKYEVRGTGERDGLAGNTVSITVGDYGEDEDKIVLQAFNKTDVLLGEATATLPGGRTDFTYTTLTVTSKFGEAISYIKFVGGSPEFPNSVLYDNITFTYVPTEFELSKSNPYWKPAVGRVVDDLVKNLLAQALNGRGEDFVYLIGEGRDGNREPLTPYQRQFRDEYFNKATEALKVGTEEWLDAVQQYLNKNYPIQGAAFAIYRASGEFSDLFRTSFNNFIAMFQVADSAVRIAEQTGRSTFDPRVLIAAGIQPYGDLLDDFAVEVLKTNEKIRLPDAVISDLTSNIKLGTYVVENLLSPKTTSQSSEATSTAKFAASFSADFSLTTSPLLEMAVFNPIEGTTEDNKLLGTANNDTIQGKEGWDILIGNSGFDMLFGGEGVDMLNGTGTSFIAGEVDILSGGQGIDIFVLGDPNRAYYDDQNSLTAGASDYALITDFEPKQDYIVLKGKFSDYIFNPREDGKGLSIFLDNDGIKGKSANDELICRIEGSTTIRPIDIMFV